MRDELKRLGAEAFRVEPAALDLRVAFAGALATAGPVVLGIALGQPHAGLNAGLGGLNVALAMPEVGNRHRVAWGLVALAGSILAAALARAVAPSPVLSIGLTLLWTGGFALLRARGREGAIVGFVLAAVFVILNGLPSASPVIDIAAEFAVGGAAGLVLMLLAGIGRRPASPEPTAAIGGNRTLRNHALRVGLATAFAVALDQLLAPSFGYWIPLTVLAVLQPDSHSSRVRLLQRAAGTVVGAGLVVLATLVTASSLPLAVLVALFALALFAVKDRSYFWMVILLTPLALLMISTVVVEGPGIAGQRLVNTAIGLAIGLAAMRVLWPDEAPAR